MTYERKKNEKESSNKREYGKKLPLEEDEAKFPHIRYYRLSQYFDSGSCQYLYNLHGKKCIVQIPAGKYER